MLGGELTLADDKLLKLAANGKSPNEIATETGMAPEKAVIRIREILNSRSLWSAAEQEQLLLHSIYDIKNRMEARIDAITGDPKLLKEYRGFLDLLGQRLSERTKINQADLDRVSRAQGMKLVHIVELAYYKARAELAQLYPNVDLRAIDAVMQNGLEEAALEFEAAHQEA